MGVGLGGRDPYSKTNLICIWRSRDTSKNQEKLPTDFLGNIKILTIETSNRSGYGTTHSGYGTIPVGRRGGNRYVEGDLLTFG